MPTFTIAGELEQLRGQRDSAIHTAERLIREKHELQDALLRVVRDCRHCQRHELDSSRRCQQCRRLMELVSKRG